MVTEKVFIRRLFSFIMAPIPETGETNTRCGSNLFVTGLLLYYFCLQTFPLQRGVKII